MMLAPQQRATLLKMLDDDEHLEQGLEIMGILELAPEERARLARQQANESRWWAASRCVHIHDVTRADRAVRRLCLQTALRWGAARMPALSSALRVLGLASEGIAAPHLTHNAREAVSVLRRGLNGDDHAALMCVFRGLSPDPQEAARLITEHRLDERSHQRRTLCGLLGLPWEPDSDNALAEHHVAEHDWLAAARFAEDSDVVLRRFALDCARRALPLIDIPPDRVSTVGPILEALAEGGKDSLRDVRWWIMGMERRSRHRTPFSRSDQAIVVIRSATLSRPAEAARAAAGVILSWEGGDVWLRQTMLARLGLRQFATAARVSSLGAGQANCAQ